MPHKIQPEKRVDRNELDSQSYQIATFFTICMCMILDFNDENPNISLDDIHKLVEYFDTTAFYDEGSCRSIFNEIDTNNDGYISVPQFFVFVSKTNELWMPICDLRLSFINHFFPHDLAMNILLRRAHIYTIREYKITHNGAYPQQSCKEFIYELLYGIPNKYRFDYDPNDNITIFDITRLMILKYRKGIFLVNGHKLLCTKKQIPKIINSPQIQQYDKIYSAIGCSTKQYCGNGGIDNESRNASRTSILSQQQKGLNQRPHSILKSTSSYHQLHKAKSTRARRSCETFDFNCSNKNLNRKLRTYKSENQLEQTVPKTRQSCPELPGYIAQ